MDAIILAAGKGSRMAPLCTKVPKPMLPLAGKPILQHVLERVHAAGIPRAVIVVEYLAEVIETQLVVPDGMEVEFVRQGAAKGTGHAVAMASDMVPKDALVLMGDSLVSQETVNALVAGHGLVVAAARVANPSAYGVLEVDGHQILKVHEKPSNPPSDLANTGMYRVPAEVLRATRGLTPSPRGELEFTDLIQNAAWIEATDWIDVGNPWQYLDAHEQMLDLNHQEPGSAAGDGIVEDGVHIRGRVDIAKGALIKSGTYIEGDVIIGANAVIGPNAYIRGPVQVGAGCKVGAFTELKNSILLDGAKAPHHNYVGDSILGHDCNLGSGTKLANIKHSGRLVRVDWNGTLIDTGRRKFGSVIGDAAKTGINSSLNPGTVLWPET